jgi:hypothetical protein
VCGRCMRQPWVGEVVAERLELQPREVEDLGEKSVGHVVTRDWLRMAPTLHEVVVQVTHVDRMNHQLAEPLLAIFRCHCAFTIRGADHGSGHRLRGVARVRRNYEGHTGTRAEFSEVHARAVRVRQGVAPYAVRDREAPGSNPGPPDHFVNTMLAPPLVLGRAPDHSRMTIS